MIIGFDERERLRGLFERNKIILEKLKSREFTVAIVGLEKAGKSTLGNALINSEILPEYTERCTYTTTELRAGGSLSIAMYMNAITFSPVTASNPLM